MTKTIHRANSRGVADHGWLKSQHTFSFASYHNPQRMGFGTLRVINDDVVAPSGGFGTHGHDNMEIISVPLSGGLRHKDSMGNTHVIKHGEIQIMSAGTGLTHSEYNDSSTEPVNFLQIWVMPKQRDIPPRYGQHSYDPSKQQDAFQLLIAPASEHAPLWINQDAYFSLGNFAAGTSGEYRRHRDQNGMYVFVIEGEIEIDGETLGKRDAIGLNQIASVTLRATQASQLLVMEVPMG
jgi:hypothetical protein